MRSGALSTVIVLSTAWAWAWAEPPSTTPAEPPQVESVLARKGLRRVGTSYVTEASLDLNARQGALKRDYQEWDQLQTRREQLRETFEENRAILANLSQQRRALLAARAESFSASNSPRRHEGPHPPPGMMPPPPPPGGGPMPGSGPPRPEDDPRVRAMRERESLSNQILKLEKQMIQVWAQLIPTEILEARLAAITRKKREDIQQREVALSGAVDATLRREAELAEDSEVRHAIEAINQTANPPVVLGRFEDTKADHARLANEPHRDADDTAGVKEPDFWLGADADPVILEALAESFQHDLGVALAKRESRRHDAEVRKKRLAAAQSKSLRDQIKRLRDEADREERARKDLIEQTSTLREAFLKSLAALRKMDDRSQGVHEEAANAGPSKDASGQPKDKATPKVQAPVALSRSQRSFLDNAEKTVFTETISLEPDKYVSWVNATLNGKPDQRILIDPNLETIRISSRFAEALGVVRDEKEAPVPVTTGEGTTLSARTAWLASVQLGSFAVEHVECLVLPEGYDAPPVLGRSFLDHFACNVDLENDRLTLVRVDVKPVYTKAPARTSIGGKAKEKGR